MNTNQKFALWCARKCLLLWKPPQEVIDWLDAESIWDDNERSSNKYTAKAYSSIINQKRTSNALVATMEAIWTMRDSAWANGTAYWTAVAFDVSEQEIRLEYISTWTDKELTTVDPDWIAYATVEIMKRSS